MALVVESTSTAVVSDSDSVTITKPTGVAVGDLLILLASGSGTATYPTCSGFTRILEQGVNGNVDTTVAMLYRVADASDVSASNYSVALAGSTTTSGAAAMMRVSGWSSGNPLFASSNATQVIDSAAYALGTSGLSITRPSQQLLIIAGDHISEDHYADYSNYSITSADANPTWTVLANNLDYDEGSGTNNKTFFAAYALSTDTSTITAFNVDVASSITGGTDSDAAIFAVICSPVNTTGTNATFAVSPAIFTNAGVTVGTVGTNATFAVSPNLPTQSGEALQPTPWTTITKS